MMDSSGVRGPTPQSQGISSDQKQLSDTDSAGAMQGLNKNTLGQLKANLVSHYGEKDGVKLYNNFMLSFAMLMLQQVQHSAQQAKKASQNMRMDTR